jgi:hypothetical protein
MKRQTAGRAGPATGATSPRFELPAARGRANRHHSPTQELAPLEHAPLNYCELRCAATDLTHWPKVAVLLQVTPDLFTISMTPCELFSLDRAQGDLNPGATVIPY